MRGSLPGVLRPSAVLEAPGQPAAVHGPQKDRETGQARRTFEYPGAVIAQLVLYLAVHSAR